jgi:hypothetical protein
VRTNFARAEAANVLSLPMAPTVQVFFLIQVGKLATERPM